MEREATLVRPATMTDIPGVQSVAGLTWRDTYRGVIPDADIEKFLSNEYNDRSMTGAVERLRDGFVVAERDGNIIGYSLAGLNREGDAELFAIYVLSKYHGIGVGSELWQAARAALVRLGHRRMCCWVLVTNRQARRFYERQGAILTEEREYPIGATMIREARYCVGQE
jgi:ribosomal protein S18 acetylase RimI-like enzyme